MPEEECRPILLQMEEDAKLGAGVSFQDVMWCTVPRKNEWPLVILADVRKQGGLRALMLFFRSLVGGILVIVVHLSPYWMVIMQS